MDSATWCRMPAAASAARRLRPEVSKNSSTALSSNEGELARSITTCVPAMACLRPSPVMVLTPVLGEAATTSWPPRRRMAPVFEPIRPVPPMTTIFMAYPPSSTTGSAPGARLQRWDSGFNSGHQNRKVRQAKLADGAAKCAAEIPSGQGPVGVKTRILPLGCYVCFLLLRTFRRLRLCARSAAADTVDGKSYPPNGAER